MIWITNESSKQSIINTFLDHFQFPEKIFAQFRLHLNGSPVNYALVGLFFSCFWNILEVLRSHLDAKTAWTIFFAAKFE